MLRKLKVYAGAEHPHAAQFRAYEKSQRAAGSSEEQRS
jgi:ribosomal protein L13